MTAEIPNTVIDCDGCTDSLNVLGDHLKLTLKPQRQVLMTEDVVDDEDENAVPEQRLFLGRKSGRGVIRFFHNFDCANAYMKKFEGKEAKLEYHSEEEIYVPADNRSPEELVEAGELPASMLDVHTELVEESENGG